MYCNRRRIEAVSYGRSFTKRGHLREEVTGSSDEEDFKERASKWVRDMHDDVATVMPDGGADPFAKGPKVAVTQQEDKRA